MLASLARRTAFGLAGRQCAAASAGAARGVHASAPLRHGKDNGDHTSCTDTEDRVLKAVEDYIREEEAQAPEELLGSSLDLEDLLRGNRHWVERMNKEDPEFFKRLGGKQQPRYLYIGCSDARVDPGRLMGLDQGKLFVHRNIGNVVSGTDLNLLSVVDFAVNFLRVPHILVVGHYDCGAVRGSIARPEDGGLGIVENWLRNIRDVARFHREELLSISDQEQRVRRLVELNVQEQCLNVFKIGTVQQRRIKSYIARDLALPRVHGLVFDPANGILQKLPLDFKKLTQEDGQIYDLYKLPDWLRRQDSIAPPEKKP